MKRKSLKDLRKNIVRDIECNEKFIKTFELDNNPQIIEMVKNSRQRVENFTDIIRYIDRGSCYQFDK